MSIRRGPQLLTYPDSLGGDLASIRELLDGPFRGLFGGVHVLPPFPSSGDRGFAPLTYAQIDQRFGSWADIRALATDHDLVLDVMVNHLSRQSPEFADFQQRGPASPYADLFMTVDKVWPDGEPPAEDVTRIFLRKPRDPFSTITIADTGRPMRVWTTFGSEDWSEQVDLDLRSETTRRLIVDWFTTFAINGVRIVRLDAVGYVVKRAGTSCFMVEPDIWEAIDWLVAAAAEVGLTVLPEIHDVPATHERLVSRGYWTYDFVLPGLTLLALETGEAARLARHLASSPERQFTTLDCHDGIPVSPDLEGVLAPAEMQALAEVILRRGGNINRILSDAPTDGVDVHQLNCTYFSALGEVDRRYLAARAIQLFAPGIPQVYYVGLLAGANDHEACARTGEGRAVNRHDYTRAELGEALTRPVVRELLDLLRLRATHPAFGGALEVETTSPSSLRLTRTAGSARAVLDVDLATGRFDLAS
jgi:sucrose phosphorylase